MDMDRYIGRLLDNRYEILEVIGTGGMAVVYKARCHRLNRLVAIKILKDEYSRDDEFRRRFHAEGEAVAMLSHPNIVQVFDVSSSDNADFIVMELIDGITLKQYMEKKGTLNWKETLHFAMQIAKALEHAHSRSIVHRDIKPHNVMVLKNGSVKVTDFGIARVMSKSNTLTREALGSVHYISPEQAKGGWVDNRSDLYSLGVVMYEMMTGRPPYDGESPVAVAIQHINGGAPAPSSLNPNIPRGMEQIIMKSMALDAKDRYPSATEMLLDMEEFRKNPAIVFAHESESNNPLLDDATKILQTDQVRQAALRQQQQPPRTTAEKVAGAAAGAATANRPHTGAQQHSRPPQAVNRPQQPPRQQPSKRSADPGRRQQQRQERPRTKTREEIREEIREEERNRMATIAIVACSAVAIIAIAIFLVSLFNGSILGRGEAMIKVPAMIGKYYEDVREYQGLVIEIYQHQYNDTVEKGRVIDQKPSAGEEVVQGTTVRLTVSMGPEPAVKIMENLAGQEYEVAKKFLEDQGMHVLPSEEFNDDVAEGRVIRTDPAQGAQLKDGDTVWLYVSRGPVIERVEMIKVTGLKYDVAYNMLRNLGFTNITPKEVESDEKEDTVIKQSEDRGVLVDVTKEIILTVSKGPKPTDKPTAPPTAPPTEAPTDPPIKEITKRIIFKLPTDRTEEYIFSLFQNGKEVIEPVKIPVGTTQIEVELTGSGVQYYELYINDEYYSTEKVDFAANG